MTLIRRVLFVAWQNPTTRRIHPVGRLLRLDGELRWEFVYIQGAREAASSGFYPFPGLSSLDHVYRSAEIPALFENRLMPKSRPDRPDFLARLGFGADVEDEIPILARSEGRKATDTIEVFGLPSFDAVRGVYRFLCFLRGVRYVRDAEERIAELRVGERLGLRHEANNPADQLAIVACDGRDQAIGWVPGPLVEDIHELESKGSVVEATVERINPNPAPVQLRLLLRLEASDAEGFVPFVSERYQPIPQGATIIRVRQEELVG